MTPLLKLEHAQLAMPRGGEDLARAFYAGGNSDAYISFKTSARFSFKFQSRV